MRPRKTEKLRYKNKNIFYQSRLSAQEKDMKYYVSWSSKKNKADCRQIPLYSEISLKAEASLSSDASTHDWEEERDAVCTNYDQTTYTEALLVLLFKY